MSIPWGTKFFTLYKVMVIYYLLSYAISQHIYLPVAHDKDETYENIAQIFNVDLIEPVLIQIVLIRSNNILYSTKIVCIIYNACCIIRQFLLKVRNKFIICISLCTSL